MMEGKAVLNIFIKTAIFMGWFVIVWQGISLAIVGPKPVIFFGFGIGLFTLIVGYSMKAKNKAE